MSTFHVTILTPERLFFEGEAEFLEYSTSEGRVGIYPGHEAMTEILSPGVLSLKIGDSVKKAALHTGFVEILPTTVRFLAEIAEWADEIDENRAREAKIRAERALREDGNNKRDEMALRRAIARIEARK